MKTINVKNFKAWQEVADASTVIDSISQNVNQFDNLSIRILRTPGGGKIMIEDLMNETNEYMLEAGDSEEAADHANNWANNGEQDYRIEMIAWGLSVAEDYKIDADYAGECNIIRVQQYYGPYYPVKVLSEYDCSEDGTGSDEPMIFASPSEAQEWIDAQEEGTYYLDHNESGRPTYTLVEA